MAIRAITCKSCGSQFKHDVKARPPAYCSKRCKRVATNHMDRVRRQGKPKDVITASMRVVCEGCGTTGVKTSKGLCKPCSKASGKIRSSIAARIYMGRSEGVPILTATARRIPERTCVVCGNSYMPKAGNRTTACSRTCGLFWTGFKRLAVTSRFRVCVTTVRNRPKRKEPAPAYVPIHKADCMCCGITFDRRDDGASRFMCSQSCRSRAERASKRIARKKRKALERGARTADSVDPFKVFDRDGWRCQMCRKKTPRSKRGTYDTNAPELDHIMPLSKGGAHSYANTQCLCRSCNAAKSDTPIGQLSLL